MKIFYLILFLFSSLLWSGTIKVTFQINMKIQLKKGLFRATDSLVARGDFQVDGGDVGNWQGNMFKLKDPNADSIYTVDVTFPDTKVGTTYNFKFVKNDSGWEPDPNRTFILQNVVNQVLPAPYFANDSIVKPVVTNTIKFTANMSDIYGTGLGVFDPNQDSILVMGLDWDNLGTVVSGDRKLMEVLSPVKRFKTTMVVKGGLGDSTKWKYRAYPETRFTNTGWELGEDHWFKYAADGQTVTLPEIKPNIIPFMPPLATDVTVRITCNMGTTGSMAPKNRYNRELIPVDQIAFIAVKGGSVFTGNWGGIWTANDTATVPPTLIVMNDKGQNGDLVANDKVWSREIVFPAGTPYGKIEYKFGCMYPGADTVNAGIAPLDNESSYGMNHWLYLYQSATTIVSNQIWYGLGGVISDNKNMKVNGFRLNQNYPNPFNPTTRLSYTIPVDAQVSLKLYNAMGEEVVTIFNGFQHASGYTVDFDGYGLSSGVYFCSLRAADYSSTIKMVLMK